MSQKSRSKQRTLNIGGTTDHLCNSLDLTKQVKLFSQGLNVAKIFLNAMYMSVRFTNQVQLIMQIKYRLRAVVCGKVGSAVASDTIEPGFESCHRQFLLNNYLLLTVNRKDKNK